MFLRFYDGAQPGKKRKLTDDERRERTKDYEANRKERSFNEKWKTGRPWLQYDPVQNKMTCLHCKDFYKQPIVDDRNRKHNSFILGSTNFRSSAIDDHEKSKPHLKASSATESRNMTGAEKINTEAGTALKLLKVSERHRLTHLFRNIHAVAKHNRPISDYQWLCQLDRAKGVEVGITYQNDRAAVDFISCIAKCEQNETIEFFQKVPFLSFMMDGTSDISGSEQETIYLRAVFKGKVTERFLNIDSPLSTSSEDLYHHVLSVFTAQNIDIDKMIGMGSDGASNMTGNRSGLSTLLRERINSELVNVHCMCHRLELAFRDVTKKFKLYDKLMTLLIGLHYFYKKSYKNKTGLQNSIKVAGKGVLPPKVTGTRWLPHLFRGMGALMKTYKAIEMHLATASHTNPKAEGLYKLMTDMHLMAFLLFLHDSLDSAMKLSLKLQKEDATLAESMLWVEGTMELLEEKKGRKCEDLVQLLESRTYNTVSLKGSVPEMAYADKILQGFVQAIKDRFMTQDKNVVNATRILHFGNWPSFGTPEFQVYGETEIKMVVKHFEKSLQKVCGEVIIADVISEWSMLKKIVSKKHGKEVASGKLSWEKVLHGEESLSLISTIIDLMLTLPSTSVRCETAFSQLKLLKTCRRARLSQSVLNDLMTVKLLSPSIQDFDPAASIDVWLGKSIQGRRPNYRRTPKSKVVPDDELSVSDDDPNSLVNLSDSGDEDSEVTDDHDDEVDDQAVGMESRYDELIYSMCDKLDNDDVVDEDCYDFQDEMLNFNRILEFTRE